MKITCIALNSNLINTNEQMDVVDYLNKKLYEMGENISLISYFDNNLDKIKNLFQEKSDLIFFLGTSSASYNFKIKENLSRIFNDNLTNSEICYSHLKKYCEDRNIPFSLEEEKEILAPKNSIPLICESNYNTGFIYKTNDTYIVFLPDSLQFVKENYKHISQIVNSISNFKCEHQIIKCFGILEKDIKILIGEYLNKDNVNINIVSNNLDNTIFIRYNRDTDISKIQEIISDIISKLNKYIYSLDDSNIFKMANDLLTLQRKKIVIAETLTLGNITKELANISNQNILDSNIFFNFEQIERKLKLDSEVIQTYGRYSVNTVYECANNLLESNTADIVLFLLGESSQSDICYIAVGDVDGIHVYKNKINIKDEKTIENLSKTAMFYLIKKLKQNDLHFM